MSRLQVSPLVKRALEIAEQRFSAAELATRLGATEVDIEAWREGFAAMPDGPFKRLLELVTDLAPGWMARR